VNQSILVDTWYDFLDWGLGRRKSSTYTGWHSTGECGHSKFPAMNSDPYPQTVNISHRATENILQCYAKTCEETDVLTCTNLHLLMH